MALLWSIWIPLLSAQEFQPFEDPYIDPDAASPQGRASRDSGVMLGLGYGLHPMYVVAPPVMVGWYQEPWIFGYEKADTKGLQAFTNERIEAFGVSRFRNDMVFGKYFVGETVCLISTVEQRQMDLWYRTFNREGQGSAKFDQHLSATVLTAGIGLLGFEENTFFGIDLIRYAFPMSESVEVREHYETWSLLSGSREQLDQNIKERNEEWLDLLKLPSGFVVYWGFWF
ncbi:MAG: hypothetical protein ACO4AU_02715 [bacterium]